MKYSKFRRCSELKDKMGNHFDDILRENRRHLPVWDNKQIDWLIVCCQIISIPKYITRKLCYRTDDRAMRLYMGACPEYISGFPDYAHGYYSQHFSWAFVPIDPMNVPTTFEVRSFTRSWDNRGYRVPQKLGSPWIRPCSIFCKNF